MTDAEQPTIEPASETTLTPIPTAPVAADAAPPPVPTAAAPRRSRRARWAVAALVVALVVGASAAVTLALTGSSPNASILGYVPGDSLAYAEVRLDLPGDQRQQVAAFLSKFPGFADQAALDTKIGETLDQLVGEGE